MLPITLAMLAALSLTSMTIARQATPAATNGMGSVVQRPVDLPESDLISLSPDGRWLVILRQADDGSDLCAFNADTLTEHVCTRAEFYSIDAIAAAWSPDGDRLAFTEDWPLLTHESDLWVFTPETGTLANLTDDGFARPGIQSLARAPIDLSPTWSPDGSELAFVRYEPDEGDMVSVGIYRIPADGGEPRLLATVGSGSGLNFPMLYRRIHWQLAGDVILFAYAYSVNQFGITPGGGIWSAPAIGGSPREIVRLLPDLEWSAPVFVDVIAPATALVFDHDSPPEPGAARFALLDLSTGQTTPLAPLAPETQAGFAIAATFSPDGSRVAFVYERPDGTQLLTIRETSGGSETVVTELDHALDRVFSGAGLIWATIDLIFNRGDGHTGALIALNST